MITLAASWKVKAVTKATAAPIKEDVSWIYKVSIKIIMDWTPLAHLSLGVVERAWTLAPERAKFYSWIHYSVAVTLGKLLSISASIYNFKLKSFLGHVGLILRWPLDLNYNITSSLGLQPANLPPENLDLPASMVTLSLR